MNQPNKPIAAWKNTVTGTIIPATRDNVLFGKKDGVIAIEAAIHPETKQYYDVNSDDNVAEVSLSGDLTRVIKALSNNRSQRLHLLQAGINISGGEAMLRQQGFYSDDDEQSVMEFEPSETAAEVAKFAEAANKKDAETEAMKQASGAAVTEANKKLTADDL